jgi:hypothetical protein
MHVRHKLANYPWFTDEYVADASGGPVLTSQGFALGRGREVEIHEAV